MFDVEPVLSAEAEALKNLLDGIHAGRFIVLNAASEGYCRSLVDAAEAVLEKSLKTPAEGYKLNANKSVAVSNDTFWEEDMTTCPRGCKVQLLGAGGVATYGVYDGDLFWKKWAPLPRNRP